jgi:hypothetical protein
MPHVNFPASPCAAAAARATAVVLVVGASAFAIADHAAPWTAHETVALGERSVPIDDDLAAFYHLPAPVEEEGSPAPCSG